MINTHLKELNGKSVKDFSFVSKPKTDSGADSFFELKNIGNIFSRKTKTEDTQFLPALDPSFTYRIKVGWDEEMPWVTQFEQFLNTPGVEQTTGFVVGNWETMYETGSAQIIEALIAARDKLPQLTALFMADVVSEENEISWIIQADMSPLLRAYPKLTYLGVRGSNQLRFENLQHANLETLVIETGGLNRVILQDVLMGKMPALSHLEIWLGALDYEGDSKPEDLAPLLSGNLFPRLKYLGLRDCEWADELAKTMATAPILNRLDVLDFSLGNIGDVGGQALLDSPFVHALQKLDLHHHYMTPAISEKFKRLLLNVDVSDVQEPDSDDFDSGEGRYIAVSE